MFFLDSINLYISSGKGGDGCTSFFRSLYSSFGKPDGGNGGKGGSVYFLGDKNLNSFYYLNYNLIYKAEDGENGQSNLKTGKNGKDLFIKVPLGTSIYDNERNLFFGEIVFDGEKLLVLEGGKGGYGNFFLRSCDASIFNKMILGASSKIAYFHLELKILADVGLLGLPNVGKSMFINVISNSLSKSADYSFTTLHPFLGVLNFDFLNKIVIADLPGIIHDSSLGRGLGFSFLKHLIKTKLLLHFIDISVVNSIPSLFNDLLIINNELNGYNSKLLNINKWLILTKIDLVDNSVVFSFDRDYLTKLNYNNIFFISSKNKIGLKKLCFNISEFFLLN